MKTKMELPSNQEDDVVDVPYRLSRITNFSYYAIGYSYELLTNPTEFITKYLYPRASTNGATLAPAFAPTLVNLGYAPAVFVLGPYDRKALSRLFEWGESSDDDPAAREPLDRVKSAVGTDTIAQFRGEKGLKEHKKIKRHLNNVQGAYSETLHHFSSFTDNWNHQYSYQENVRYLVSNIIAKCVFGIPYIAIEDMKMLQDISHALAHYEPNQQEFKQASQALQNFSDRIVQQTGHDIIHANKYLNEQLEEGDGLEKLLALKAGGSLLVEGNLSNTIMIALACIMRDDDIKMQLRAELQDVNFSLIPKDEIQANGLYAKLNACPFLHKIYLEALRYVSAGVMIARKTSRASEWNVQDKEGNTTRYAVPGGSYLFAPVRAMAHDPNLWSKPQEFNPYRFDAMAKLNDYACNGSIPFMLGSRSCPAAAVFVKVVFKLAISVVITQNEFTLNDEMNPIPASSMHPIYAPPTMIDTLQKICRLEVGSEAVSCLFKGRAGC